MSSASHTLPLAFSLKVVRRLLTRELHRKLAEAGPDADRDEITADMKARIADAVPPEDYDTLVRSLDAIAREFGWDESQPMPPRPERRNRRGHSGHADAFEGSFPFPGFLAGRGSRIPFPFPSFTHGSEFPGMFPRPGSAHGKPGRWVRDDHRSHSGHGCSERHDSAPVPDVDDAFERGFVRGYEQAQRG